MQAKEYLQQAFRLNARIDANKQELERLRSYAECVKSMSDLQPDKVQTSGAGDRMGDTVARIVDFEREIQLDIDTLIELMGIIKDQLNLIPNDKFRLILQKRYINFQKWDDIAFDLGFSNQYAHRIHGKALAEFQKLLTG